MSRSRTSVVGLILLAIVASGCRGSVQAASVATGARRVGGGADTAAAAENPVFAYVPITSAAQVRQFGPVSLVVAGPQNIGPGETAAVQAIHAVGAKAYAYQEAYWAPLHRAYQGFRLGTHPDWAFCRSGTKPLELARRPAERWAIIDLNERAVQQFLLRRFESMKAAGWDGVFFDRGGIALAGYAQNPQIWNTKSTCTQDPVRPGAAFADAWLHASGLAKQAGLDLIVNYGDSPFDPRVPMRPDPHDPRCAQQGSQCLPLADGWKYPTWVSDEAVGHPRDTGWALDYQSNLSNEQDPAHGGHVLGLITAGALGGDASRKNVFFEWARTKLFDIPLAVSIWDPDACVSAEDDAACTTLVTHPELSSVQLGDPLDAKPVSDHCGLDGVPHCVWTRRYAQGAMIANVQPDRVRSYTLLLGTSGCRFVRDVWSGEALADDRCVHAVTLDLQAWSGRPLAYSTSPFVR